MLVLKKSILAETEDKSKQKILKKQKGMREGKV